MKTGTNLLMVAVGLAGLLSLGIHAAAADEAGEAKNAGRRAEIPKGETHAGDRAAMAERFIQRMKAENPEEFNRLLELRKSDPEAFRKEMREQWLKRQEPNNSRDGVKSQARGEHLERRENKWEAMEDAACLPLVRKFHAAKTPEEAAQAKAELAAAVEKTFDTKTADQEMRMKKAAEELAKRKEKKAEICAKRVEFLTKKHSERPGGGKNGKGGDPRRTRATPDTASEARPSTAPAPAE